MLFIRSDIRKHWNQHLQTFAGICLLIGSAAGHATVIQGEGSAYALFVNLHTTAPAVTTVDALGQTITLMNAIDANATIGPVAPSSVSSPPPGNDSNSLATFSASVENVVDVNTGLLSTDASSNVNGLPGSRLTDASATVNQLELGIPLLNLLDLDALTLRSTAEVMGDFASLTATGNTILQETSLNLFDNLVSLDLGVYTDANNQVLDVNIDVIADILASGIAGVNADLLSGLSIILNEQVEICTTDFFCSIAVNAMRISFDNFSHTGLFASLDPLLGTTVENTLTLNGDIIISHSQAMMQAIEDPVQIPTPGSLALVALALGLMLAYRRRLANKRPHPFIQM